MKTKSYLSSVLLTLNGVVLMLLGLYFVFIRPSLLPEDIRFMGTTLDNIRGTLPGLLLWLRRVFWVMGGFMFASGLLILYVAQTSFTNHTLQARLIVTLAALSSIGWMAMVNFLIDSNFKWLILSFNLPWIVALILSRGERRQG
jgi:hypothetical protein